MEKVRVKLDERSYDIKIGSGILPDIGKELKGFNLSPTIAIISNPTVFNLYGSTTYNALKNAGFEPLKILIPDGEEYKNYEQTYFILTELLKNRLDRNSCLLALGGGVIGDITGFVASIYMRGIHFVQMPTTLLSQVDSSVGGKTGINHELGKNMIGTFYQPKLVWIDIDTLKTLPKRQLISGIAEIIKYSIIWDEGLFKFLRENKDAILNLDADAVQHIIKRSCQIKAEVVSKDEREAGLRSILNYGHTIGHAIETETGYRRYLHGEAVAIGMHLEAKLSNIMGHLDSKQLSMISEIIDSYGLPLEVPEGLDIDRLISHMKLDKKVEAGQMKFILVEKIGAVRIHKGIDLKDLKKAIK